MSLQFCQLKFPVKPAVMRDAIGNVLPQYPLQLGSYLIHWADPSRAVGWIREAHRLLNDQTRLSALDAPVNRQNVAANRNQAAAQLRYVHEVISAIAHAYNLLNLVWWNDPEARRLYRKHIAGPPTVENAGSTNTVNRSVFQQDLDYNPHWYTKDEYFPHAYLQANGWAPLQNVALRQTAKYGSNAGNRFGISTLLLLAPTTPLTSGQSVELATAIYNVPIVRMKYAQTCSLLNGVAMSQSGSSGNFDDYGDTGANFGSRFSGIFNTQTSKETPSSVREVEFPWIEQCRDYYPAAGMMTWLSSDSPAAVMPDGSLLPRNYDDWRAAYVGSFYNGWTGTVITAPLRNYLDFLKEWAQTLVERSPTQIIQDARAFTVYQNSMTVQNNGSNVHQVVNSIVGTNAELEAQKHAQSAEATVASTFLIGASGVAATVPGAGTIASVILGAAAAVVTVTDMLIVKGTHGHGRDDLGRYKLQLERAWLSGDPTAIDAQSGAPILPASENTDPPGKGSTWTELTTINGKPVCPSFAVSGSGKSQLPVGLLVVAMAGAAGVGYWYLQRKKRR